MSYSIECLRPAIFLPSSGSGPLDSKAWYCTALLTSSLSPLPPPLHCSTLIPFISNYDNICVAVLLWASELGTSVRVKSGSLCTLLTITVAKQLRSNSAQRSLSASRQSEKDRRSSAVERISISGEFYLGVVRVLNSCATGYSSYWGGSGF